MDPKPQVLLESVNAPRLHRRDKVIVICVRVLDASMCRQK